MLHCGHAGLLPGASMEHAVIQLSPVQLALAFLPVAITLAILFKWSFGVGRSLYALGRMLLQLLLIGYVLAWIFGAGDGWLVLIVLLVMLLASSWIALGTVGQQRRHLLVASLVSIAVGGGLTLALVTQAVLQLDPWFLPRYMIPLAGMVFANAMTAVSLCAERLYAEMKARGGVGRGASGRLLRCHDTRDQFAVCGRLGVAARYDDGADTVRRISFSGGTLPDHGDVHDFCQRRDIHCTVPGYRAAASRDC